MLRGVSRLLVFGLQVCGLGYLVFLLGGIVGVCDCIWLFWSFCGNAVACVLYLCYFGLLVGLSFDFGVLVRLSSGSSGWAVWFDAVSAGFCAGCVISAGFNYVGFVGVVILCFGLFSLWFGFSFDCDFSLAVCD